MLNSYYLQHAIDFIQPMSSEARPESRLKTSQKRRSQHLRNNTLNTLLSFTNDNKVREVSQQLQMQEVFTERDTSIYTGCNQVLIYSLKKLPKIIYVPVYMRVKLERIHSIIYRQSRAEIEVEIRLWAMMNQFPQIVQDEMVDLMKLEINNKRVLKLKECKEQGKSSSEEIRNISKNVQQFKISEKLMLDIEGNTFWSPYEVIKLIAHVEMKKIKLGDCNSLFYTQLSPAEQQLYRDTEVQFNFLDAHPFLQFSFGEVRRLGPFDIAESMVDITFTSSKPQPQGQLEEENSEIGEHMQLNLVAQVLNLNEKVKKQNLEDGSLTPDSFEHGQLIIPLYKYPSSTLISVFLPIFILSILGLGVFFEDNDMTFRSGNLAVFQVGLIAFFPTIRKNLPETPKIVLTEIIVYFQGLSTIICFFYSLVVNRKDDYTFVWSETPEFLACIAITGLNICFVVGMFLLHKLKWQRDYNRMPAGSLKYMQAKTLDTDDCDEWWNKECEEEFKLSTEMGLVKPLFPRRVKKSKPKFSQREASGKTSFVKPIILYQ